MLGEIPFHTQDTRRSRKSRSASQYRDVLPEYGKLLGRLSRHLMWHHGDGVLTLGNSADNMWKDMRSMSPLQSFAILPPAEHITGEIVYELYTGNLFDMESAVRRSGILFPGKVIVEDYARRASKIIKLDGLFKHLGFAVRFAVLYASPHALWEFADYGIPVHVVATKTNQRLQDLLATRRTDRWHKE